MDKDEDKDIHMVVNPFINSQSNSFTKGIHGFDVDFEEFLKIEKVPKIRRDLKPLNIMKRYYNQEIEETRIEALKTIIEELIS